MLVHHLIPPPRPPRHLPSLLSLTSGLCTHGPTPKEMGYPPLSGRARVPPHLITSLDFLGGSPSRLKKDLPWGLDPCPCTLPTEESQSTTHTLLCFVLDPNPCPRKETKFRLHLGFWNLESSFSFLRLLPSAVTSALLISRAHIREGVRPLQIGLMTAVTSALWSHPPACMEAP